ncbi:hypothetical protein BDV97DRAFT_356780 [Delphinella strobiligena]|nr:hypothetical protein BDV97DRAFT_356780 [Delphinella strobiligena]
MKFKLCRQLDHFPSLQPRPRYACIRHRNSPHSLSMLRRPCREIMSIARFRRFGHIWPCSEGCKDPGTRRQVRRFQLLF